MPNPQVVTVIAFPVDEQKRQLVSALAGFRLPGVYTGSKQRACAGCGMAVWVGPRSLAYMRDHPEAQPYCPWCVVKVADGADKGTYVSLRNPEFDNARRT